MQRNEACFEKAERPSKAAHIAELPAGATTLLLATAACKATTVQWCGELQGSRRASQPRGQPSSMRLAQARRANGGTWDGQS
mmetsp:Transcript_63357/g.147590  ORF Transcript_63357/g.147590 Transcript_63357/m.147590 type:complete len:82 (+) Transcript_63357:59-304(+)